MVIGHLLESGWTSPISDTILSIGNAFNYSKMFKLKRFLLSNFI